ncbi:hypothetical protein CPB85DRAFT_1366522, partial [Mucidula mucida]
NLLQQGTCTRSVSADDPFERVRDVQKNDVFPRAFFLNDYHHICTYCYSDARLTTWMPRPMTGLYLRYLRSSRLREEYATRLKIWHELESKQTVINLITPPQPTIPRTPVNQRGRRRSLRESIHTPHTMARRSLSPAKVMHSTLLPAFELRPERHKNPFATRKTMTKAPSPFKKRISKSRTRSQVEHGSLLSQLDATQQES